MKLLIILTAGMFLLMGTMTQADAPVPASVITKDSPAGGFIDQKMVESFVKKIQSCFDADLKNYQEVSYLKYSFRLDELQNWLNYQFLEADSGIDTGWFKQLYEYIRFFHETKREYDLSSLPEQSKFKTDNVIKFQGAIKNFDAFVNKPTKANQARVNYLKREQKKYLDSKKATSKKKK